MQTTPSPADIDDDMTHGHASGGGSSDFSAVEVEGTMQPHLPQSKQCLSLLTTQRPHTQPSSDQPHPPVLWQPLVLAFVGEA